MESLKQLIIITMKKIETTKEKAGKFGASELWNTLNKGLFKCTEEIDLSIFRKPDNKLNARLASWPPNDLTQRYYKNILFNLVSSMSDDFFVYYERLGNSN